MRTLVFASSFNRAFKALIRREPEMEAKIARRLEILVTDPFTLRLKPISLKESYRVHGLLLWSMTVELSLISRKIQIQIGKRSF